VGNDLGLDRHSELRGPGDEDGGAGSAVGDFWADGLSAIVGDEGNRDGGRVPIPSSDTRATGGRQNSAADAILSKRQAAAKTLCGKRRRHLERRNGRDRRLRYMADDSQKGAVDVV